MPLNLTPDYYDDRGLQVNLKAIENHLADDHYIRGFTPGEFIGDPVPNTTFTIEPVATPRFAALSMPDAVSSFAAVSWRKPTQWRKGAMRVRYWYTADGGSTNNFVVATVITATRTGAVIGAASTYLDTGLVTIPGPAVAYTVAKAGYYYTTISLGNDDEIFSLRLLRSGPAAGDTNVNKLLILYAEVEHIPAFNIAP